MASRISELVTRLIAKDDASKVIETVADELEALEKQGDAAITVSAEDKATPEIRSISEKLADLSDEDKKIVLTAQVANAERDIDRILRSLTRVDRMDQKEIDIRVNALGDARAELDRVQDELRQLDGESATVHVEADGLDEMLAKLDSLPGKFGEIGAGISGIVSKIGAGGAIGAGVTALVGGLVAAAEAAKDVALEAQTMAQLTGASVEEASRLQAIWKTTGADVNDLNDIVVQLNGALQQSPELASKIGVNLADGRNAVERLVEVLGLADKGLISMTDQSTLFGEEGIRQVAALTAGYDDLGRTIEELPAPVDAEDAQKARDLQNAMLEVQTTLNKIVLTIGQAMIPLLEKAADKAADIAPKAEPGIKGATELLELLALVLGGMDKLKAIGVDPFKFSVDPRTLDFWEQPLNPLSPFINSADFAITKANQVTEALFGPDLEGHSIISDEEAQREEDAIRTAIALGNEQAGLAAKRQEAIDKYSAAILVAGAMIKANNEAWGDVVDNANKIPGAVEEAVRKAQEFDEQLDESKISAAELMDEFDTAKIEAATSALGDFLAARQPGVTWLDTLGDTKEKFGEIFKQIKQNEGKIPDIFKVGTEAGRDFRDAIDEASQQVNDRLVEALKNTEGNFDEVRRQAKALRDQFRERIALKLGVDLEHATREERTRIEGLVNAVIPTDKQIRVGIKLAEEDLAKLKADLSIAELEKLLPATALQLKVDLAEGDITPEEAAATAQEALNAEGLNIDLDVDTSKADPALLRFADEEQRKLDGRPLFVPVSPNLPSDNDMEHVSTTAQDFYDSHGVTLPVTPVLVRGPTGSGTGGIPIPAMAPTGRGAGPVVMPAATTLPGVTVPYQVVINNRTEINAGAVGDRSDIMRAVEDANRRIGRLLPARP